MGLDVYLYKWNDDPKKWQARKNRYEIESEEIAKAVFGDGGYASATEELKEEWRNKCKNCKNIARELELNDDYGEIPSTVQEKIEINSAKYPDHLFKIGYLRSSYNEAGINRVLENVVGKSLYDIFKHDKDAYEFVPDWEDAKLTLSETLEQFRKAKKEIGNVFVEKVMFNIFSGPTAETPTNEKAALEVYRKELARSKSMSIGGSYSNSAGEFHMDKPLKVRALMPGLENVLAKGMPCTYVVYEIADNEGEGDWYERALEITGEMIDWAMAQPDPSKLCLHWSS